MRKVNWDNVQEKGGFTPITPGGYVAAITKVEDHEDKQYLRIYWDFVEEPYRGSNARTYQEKRYWPMWFPRSYKEANLGYFKSFKTQLEKSNPGYHFQEDRLQDLSGKYIGVVLRPEEYIAGDGTVKVRNTVYQTRSVDAIRAGNFTVPELKKLYGNSVPDTQTDNSGFQELTDEDVDGELPF